MRQGEEDDVGARQRGVIRCTRQGQQWALRQAHQVWVDLAKRTPRVGGRTELADLPIVVMTLLAVGLAASQASSRHGIRERFSARGAVTADVLTSYVADLLAHETQVANTTLSGPQPRQAFTKEVAAFGFQAAVLL